MSLLACDADDEVSAFSLRFLLIIQTIATIEPQRTVREPTMPPTMAPMLLGEPPSPPPPPLLLFESPFVPSAWEADGAALVEDDAEVDVPVSEAILEVDAGASVVDVVGWATMTMEVMGFVA